MKKFLPFAVIAALLFIASSAFALQTGDTAPGFDLSDQFGKQWSLNGQKDNVTVLIAATDKSGEAMGPWVDNLKSKYGSRIQVLGLIDLHGIPGFARGMARSRIRKETKDPLMIDFSGSTAKAYGASDKFPVVVVIGKDLIVRSIQKSNYDSDSSSATNSAIDKALKK